MKARVTVTLKSDVLDPPGRAIAGALHGLGFTGVTGVRQGKLIEIEMEDAAEAAADIEAMCKALLANPVIETYRIEILT